MNDTEKLRVLCTAVKLDAAARALQTALGSSSQAPLVPPPSGTSALSSNHNSLGVTLPTGPEGVPSVATRPSSTTTSGTVASIVPAHCSPSLSTNATGYTVRPPSGTHGSFTAPSSLPVASGSGQHLPTLINPPGPSSPEVTRSSTKRKHATGDRIDHEDPHQQHSHEEWAKVMQLSKQYGFLPPSSLDTRDARERAEKLNSMAVPAPTIPPVAQPSKKTARRKGRRRLLRKIPQRCSSRQPP